MKQITAGIVAHVDAGKTTLTEAMLYQTGTLRKLGRVDNGDAFLDSDDLEKKRGITIFSHQANLNYQDLKLTLLDTPGHMDFASQTEQVLSVLDYAILVISATDGIQGYTRTLWRLLQHYQVPTFIFVNKMDVETTNKVEVLEQLKTVFSDGCIDFTNLDDASLEQIALQDNDLLTTFLETSTISDTQIKQLIQKRLIFPVFFGSALKLDSIDEFLSGMNKWTVESESKTDFGAKVFKITHDDKQERLTWVKVTGGEIRPKEVLVNSEKANQLRIYNGEKFELVQVVKPGEVCAITGLTSTYPGMGLGIENDSDSPTIQPVLTYSVKTSSVDVHQCLQAFRELEDEDPQLHVTWSEHLQEIRISIMGKVQLEILQQIMLERFDIQVEFGEGSILYQETINQTIEGVGHFEPLRHYAEVHVLIEPGQRNSGIVLNSECSLDYLSKNWQHQVLTNLKAKEHLGVLTGAPLTDVKITLVAGKASNVHSVGGDFREATLRSVRQGLMMLKERNGLTLLEPWYDFRLVVDSDQVGRAINDIQKMNGDFQSPQNLSSGQTLIKGSAPVASMQDYSNEVRSYTHGQGQLELTVSGYKECHNSEEIIQKADYSAVSDLVNTPDSVFCAHGAGYPVSWKDVPNMAHVSYVYPDLI